MTFLELKKISGHARYASTVLLCVVAVDAPSTETGEKIPDCKISESQNVKT